MIHSMHVGDWYAFHAKRLRDHISEATWIKLRARALAYWNAGCHNV